MRAWGSRGWVYIQARRGCPMRRLCDQTNPLDRPTHACMQMHLALRLDLPRGALAALAAAGLRATTRPACQRPESAARDHFRGEGMSAIHQRVTMACQPPCKATARMQEPGPHLYCIYDASLPRSQAVRIGDRMRGSPGRTPPIA